MAGHNSPETRRANGNCGLLVALVVATAALTDSSREGGGQYLARTLVSTPWIPSRSVKADGKMAIVS